MTKTEGSVHLIKERFQDRIKKIIGFILNPRLILCFGIAWIITNGWSYILLAIGTYFSIEWMAALAGAYLAFLWLPFTPEKILTAIIAMVLLRFLFPNDQKTLSILTNIYNKTKEKFHLRKKKRKK